MIFTQYWFIEFAAIVLPVYWLLRWPLARLLFLLLACAVFHGHYAGAAGVLPVIVLGITVYFLGLTGNPKACIAGIVLCAGTLVFYKYTEFLCSGLLAFLSPSLSVKAVDSYTRHIPGIPLAISFFTFEFVHYLYEVRRKRPPIRHPLDFALFTIFFPSLVAGPIKRYDEFLASLKSGIRKVSSDDIAVGLVRIATGYFKKTCIADNLTTYVNTYVPYYSTLPQIERWKILFAIALRILMDFSGYSDIAIGFARLFGIRLMENFNWPYLAINIQNFWQRWHISLSTWIRDYIYIPLGGGRVGVPRRVANGLIAFGLCGLWHGAAWHYVLWGIYHGLGLAVCANYRKAGAPGRWLGKAFSRIPVFGWAVTLIFVCLGWLLFFYPVKQAAEMAVGLVPEKVVAFFNPEPPFQITTIKFGDSSAQSSLERIRSCFMPPDGWVSGVASFKVPMNAPFHEVEFEVLLPDLSGFEPSAITVSVNGRRVAARPLGFGVTKFSVPLESSRMPAWLTPRLHLRNLVEIEGAKKFTLPASNGREAAFRILSITFR